MTLEQLRTELARMLAAAEDELETRRKHAKRYGANESTVSLVGLVSERVYTLRAVLDLVTELPP